MIPIRRLVWLTVSIVSIAVAVLAVASGTLRSAYVAMAERKLASIRPPDFAFVGDSLTENCSWRWELRSAFIINLAVSGTDIRDIARQVVQASALKADVISIEAGINDIILESAPVDRIAYDFGYLLQRLPATQKAIVTLVPFVSAQTMNARIQAANSVIRVLAEARRLPVVDLNPRLAPNGVRSREMTTDGVHFNDDACRIWVEEIRAQAAVLKSLGRTR